MPILWVRYVVMGTPAVVTPEAVPLDLQPAGLGSRFVALLIDWAVQAMLGFALLLVGIGLSVGEAGGVGIALFFLLTFVVMFGYPIALETLWRGRTLGKAAMGLRVVTTEGGPVRFRHAAIRAALGMVDFFLTSGAAAVISVLATRNNQRLGDLVAGTLVLRERTGLPPPQAAEFSVPAGLESYAASLDVSGMTADDYRAVRAFLLRAPGLDYKVRYQLAIGLADPLSDRVRPMPPAGVHPAWWLICVAAVYQQRTAAPPADALVALGSGRRRRHLRRRRPRSPLPALEAPVPAPDPEPTSWRHPRPRTMPARRARARASPSAPSRRRSVRSRAAGSPPSADIIPKPGALVSGLRSLVGVPAYLDNAATTAMRAEAVEAMLPFLRDRFGNPSGSHAMAREARKALDEARDVVAACLGAEPGEVVFTGGGTEADNLAVAGVHRLRGGTVVCSAVEHHAVLHACADLGGRLAPVTADGVVDLDGLAAVLDPTSPSCR